MCGVARWETSRLFSKVASARGTGPPRRHARGRRKQELQMRESLAPEMNRIDRAAAAAATIKNSDRAGGHEMGGSVARPNGRAVLEGIGTEENTSNGQGRPENETGDIGSARR